MAEIIEISGNHLENSSIDVLQVILRVVVTNREVVERSKTEMTKNSAGIQKELEKVYKTDGTKNYSLFRKISPKRVELFWVF